MTASGINFTTIPIVEAFMKLVEVSGKSATSLRSILIMNNNISVIWYVMGVVGLVTTFGLYVDGKWTYRFAMELETAENQ